jgi:predicted acetyltransferase
MFDKTESELWGMFERPGRRVVGYRDGSRVLAYAVIEFVKLRDDNFVLQDMLVRELIYDTPDALLELLTFFHSLADQVSRIVLPTQDEYLYHLFADPRDGSGHMMPSVAQQTNVSGLGMMYRVIDVAQLFHVLRERDFGGQTCRVKLSVEDTFLPENDGSHVVEFENGRARGAGASDFDVEVRLDVAKFSSLLVGAVTFEALHRLGLAGISDPWYVDTVHRIFATGTKPMCITEF